MKRTIRITNQPVILRCYGVLEHGWWYVHCLDLCLVSRGRTIDAAQEALRENILGYMAATKTKDIRQAFRTAPLSSRIEYLQVLLSHFIKSTRRFFLGDLAWTGRKLVPAGT